MEKSLFFYKKIKTIKGSDDKYHFASDVQIERKSLRSIFDEIIDELTNQGRCLYFVCISNQDKKRLMRMLIEHFNMSDGKGYYEGKSTANSTPIQIQELESVSTAFTMFYGLLFEHNKSNNVKVSKIAVNSVRDYSRGIKDYWDDREGLGEEVVQWQSLLKSISDTHIAKFSPVNVEDDDSNTVLCFYIVGEKDFDLFKLHEDITFPAEVKGALLLCSQNPDPEKIKDYETHKLIIESFKSSLIDDPNSISSNREELLSELQKILDNYDFLIDSLVKDPDSGKYFAEIINKFNHRNIDINKEKIVLTVQEFNKILSRYDPEWSLSSEKFYVIFEKMWSDKLKSDGKENTIESNNSNTQPEEKKEREETEGKKEREETDPSLLQDDSREPNFVR